MTNLIGGVLANQCFKKPESGQRQHLLITRLGIFFRVMTTTILLDHYRHSLMKTMTDDGSLCVYEV